MDMIIHTVMGVKNAVAKTNHALCAKAAAAIAVAIAAQCTIQAASLFLALIDFIVSAHKGAALPFNFFASIRKFCLTLISTLSSARLTNIPLTGDAVGNGLAAYTTVRRGVAAVGPR